MTAQRQNPVSAAARRRAARKQEILDATRKVFDDRGLRDAQIEDIAKEVGINRAIIYRHFSGKEELFALTVVTYLHELRERMTSHDDASQTPEVRLRRMTAAFLDFGSQYPAFVDCALDLLRRDGEELLEEISAASLIELGSAISLCLQALVQVIEAGNALGDFQVEDPNLLANVYYTQGLGALTLARLQLQVEQAPSGGPLVRKLAFDTVRDYLIDSTVAMARPPR